MLEILTSELFIGIAVCFEAAIAVSLVTTIITDTKISRAQRAADLAWLRRHEGGDDDSN